MRDKKEMKMDNKIAVKMKYARYEDFDELLTKHGYPTIHYGSSIETSTLNILGALKDEVMGWKEEVTNMIVQDLGKVGIIKHVISEVVRNELEELKKELKNNG